MSSHRIYNFNAGPAALPLPVLKEIQASFLDFQGSGMSVTEISHRSSWFDAVINDAVTRTKRLLKLDDRFQVLFIQGGASMQFCMIPMNFLPSGKSEDYVDTGTWSTKAIKEAQILGKAIKIVASSADKNYCYIPQNIAFNNKADFVHLTSNNTIKGTQWAEFPDTKGVPIFCDMSSDIMSRPLDAAKFGLIYAGAQKNAGQAGVCLVIIRNDMLDLVPDGNRWDEIVAQARAVEAAGATIINSGIGGDTSGGLLGRFYPDAIQHHPDMVIIMGGTNDLWWDLEINLILANIFTMTCQARHQGIARVRCGRLQS